MPSRTLTVTQLKDKEEKEKQGGGLRGSKKTTGEVKKYTRDDVRPIIENKDANIEDLINFFKQPTEQVKVKRRASSFPSVSNRKAIISRIWQTNRHPIKRGVSSEEANNQLRKYLSDFEPIKTFLNKDENRYLIYTQEQKDKGEVPDALSTKDILSTLGSTKVNNLFEKIKEDFDEVTSTGQIGQLAKEISDSKQKTPRPSKKPTAQLDDEIKRTASLIKDLNEKLKATTDASDITDLTNQIFEEQKYLLKLREDKKKGSNPMGNVRTKVAEIEKKEKTEEEKEDEKEDDPPRPVP